MSGDDLSAYDDLAAQEGPNSRRGVFTKEWCVRILDLTTATWCYPESQDALDPEPQTPTTAGLSIQTKGLRISTLSESPPTARPEQPPLPPVRTVLRPTHLKMHHFGSRFLPHSTTPIRCLLPLQADCLLPIGHDEGLSGPEGAAMRPIWEGESVFQMLKLDHTGSVVLMLVGPESDSLLVKDPEYQRTVRMYILASLVSLVKWAVANKGAHPLNLGTFAAQNTPTKKNRPTSSIVARRLKSLVPTATSSSSAAEAAQARSGRRSLRPVRPPPRTNSDESSWEMVDDLPLRWARDFVPLALAEVAAGECECAELCAVDA
ncbi:hypothetical protein B0H14DRAFT_3448254 [Mycena olivaceomarginata]|nr:hypothetical protein B0H14DRAFT_3448254 [Mycena olivaceomarginata]